MSGVYYYKSFTDAQITKYTKWKIPQQKKIKKKKENCLKLGQIVHFYSSLVSLS